jgi:uncharacterized protein (DUF1800 family)
VKNCAEDRSLTNLSVRVALLLLAPAVVRVAVAQESAAAIRISPGTANVRLLGTETFYVGGVTVTPSMGWQLVSAAPNSKPDNSGALGTIDSKGHYQAPAAMPGVNTVSVQFFDSAHGTVLASATVTLLNPVPDITKLTPTFMNVGLQSTVVIGGKGFVPGSTLLLDGQPVAAAKYTVKSATEIDFTDTPSAAVDPRVTVQNPMPDGKVSNAVTLEIEAAIAVTLSPEKATIRGGTTLGLHPTVHNNPNQQITFTVNGLANGDATVGTITTDSKGNILYTAPFVLPGNTVSITAASVAEPTAKATMTVTLQNPMPVITAVSPSPVIIGSNVNLTITGEGFASGAKVVVGGHELAAQIVSDKQITATGMVPAAPGREVAVTVANPAPGPVTSAPFNVPEAVAKNCTASGQPAECRAYADAVRFLEMATWGPTPDSIAHLQAIGRDAWLAEQFALPTTPFPLATTLHEGPSRIQQEFFNRALIAPDQLRQRVAFALSEIFVVSATKDDRYEAMRSYIENLSDYAFDTYRNVLGVMTLSPGMGWFLDMVNNDKANPAKNTVANENYARESAQLFSIGLSMLNLDGTPATPATPTFGPSFIPELAKVFTGWTYPAIPDTESHWNNPPYFAGPMVSFPEHHDETMKTLNLAGQQPCIVNPNQTPEQDLQIALDCLANHPNVAPFISYRLIQRLVKSNPSPAYVKDIATVFNSSGGSLKAVVQAILTHSEAATPGSGKLMEPVLYATSLLRALNATVLSSQAAGIAGQTQQMGEQVLYAPSVFNYFSPFYRIPGFGVVAPEFQILNAASATSRLNFVYRAVNNQLSKNIRLDFTNFQALASDTVALIGAINEALYYGAMPANLHDELKAIAGEVAQQTKDKGTLVRTLMYFAAAAPQYQVEQ